MHSLFFLPVFYLKTPTARVWTAASLQPLCLLAASLCFATPNMMKRAFWGVRWGDWSYSAFPTLRLCVWTLWWNLCLLPFSLRRKLYLCVCHVLTTQQTHRRCTYKLVLTFIVMHTHTHTHVHSPNLHGFDDAKQQEPLGAGCLDKTKQMFMCTMPS